MKYNVIKRHKSNYPDPIILEKGEKVRLGQNYNGPEDWPNWLYCYKLGLSREGWIPEQIIRKKDEYGIVTENYTGKELNVEEGEQVQGNMELNGWIWCKREKDGEEGWISKSNLKENE